VIIRRQAGLERGGPFTLLDALAADITSARTVRFPFSQLVTFVDVNDSHPGHSDDDHQIAAMGV
jgi:hypothetical protein